MDLLLGALRFHPTYAGPAIRFKRYAPGLRARGVEMRVLSGASRDNAPEGAGVGALLPEERVDGIVVRRVVLPELVKKDAVLVTHARALARVALHKEPAPDVVQLLDLDYRLIPWLLRLRLRGVPLVYTHTMVRDPSITGLRWLKNFVWRAPIQLMDCVVVSSGVMRDALTDRRIRPPVEVIPNGVDLERFHPVGAEGRDEMRRALGLPAPGLLIMFVGGFLERRKGLDVLAEAWARLARELPDAYLVLVGPTLDAFRQEGPQQEFLTGIEDTLRASGAFDRVIFTGRVEHVECYLQAADIFVFPSRREGMPNVVPEAFACGTPTVLTPFIGLPTEFGRAGREYILAEREPDDLARAVRQLAEDANRRRSLSQAARSWVEKELDVQRSLDRYAKLYARSVRR